jgi:hypothetical protein
MSHFDAIGYKIGVGLFYLVRAPWDALKQIQKSTGAPKSGSASRASLPSFPSSLIGRSSMHCSLGSSGYAASLQTSSDAPNVPKYGSTTSTKPNKMDSSKDSTRSPQISKPYREEERPKKHNGKQNSNDDSPKRKHQSNNTSANTNSDNRTNNFKHLLIKSAVDPKAETTS